jgi:tetratricopeptide (TPR) repeat protein
MPPLSVRQRKRDDLLQRALALHRGDPAGAEVLYRRLIRDDPRDADALHLCGLAREARGDRAGAESFIRRALALKPDFAAAWSNLGNILLAGGSADAARPAYERALAADAHFAPARHNLAKLLLAQGALDAALAQSRAACRAQPGEVSHWLLQAEIAQAAGDAAGAEAALRRAIALAPRASEPRTNLGNLLLGLNRHEDAAAEHRRAVEAQPQSATAWYGLAAAQRAAGLVEAALASVDAALRLDPAMAEAWNLKGACLRALGQFDEAIAHFERAAALRPGFAGAIRNIATSRRAGRDAGEAMWLQDLLRGGLGDEEAIATGFALAKVLDDGGRYDDAFAVLAEANARAARRLADAGRGYDAGAFEAQARAALDAGGDAAGVVDSELPVLVVGMPRSGTTLVEQILASHPEVVGAGELPDLSRLCAAGGEVAAPYVEGLRGRAGGAGRVVDKMPDNILLLGRVAAALPRARVIFCRRDPRDMALSCFATRFAAGNAFAYALWSCGHRAGVTEWLAASLAGRLPLATQTVRYESLVGDLEGEARRLIAFLGLDWDPRCLDFHRTDRPILTASAWQARQPVFASSVGRWRHYEAHLAPMLAGLSAAAERGFRAAP